MNEILTIVCTTVLTFTLTELLRAGLRAWRKNNKKPHRK